MAFNVREHLTKLRGSEYLEVKWRLVWFRDEHPDWTIETTPLELDTERQVAVFHATIKDTEGRTIAQATKMENAKGFPDYLEKAETGAIGRALAMCGYGTQFAPEFDEGERIVNSPVPPKGSSKPAPPPAPECSACGKAITATPKYTVEKLIEASTKRYGGQALCYSCSLEKSKEKKAKGKAKEEA